MLVCVQEWGDPHDAGAREVIRAFDPVPNVKKQDYPWLLCIGANPRVLSLCVWPW